MPQKKVVTRHLKNLHLLTWSQPMKSLRVPTQKSILQLMKDHSQCNNCPQQCNFIISVHWAILWSAGILTASLPVLDFQHHLYWITASQWRTRVVDVDIYLFT